MGVEAPTAPITARSTVIYSQNFGLMTVFEVILLIPLSSIPMMVFLGVKAFRENEKGHEAQTKARESTIPKLYNFFISTGPFGVLC